jgi:hypothetical protein
MQIAVRQNGPLGWRVNHGFLFPIGIV